MCSWFKWVFVLWLGSTLQLSAFSLLGPYADWMDEQKSYRLPGEIGGPMGLHEEYRWNIPEVYYGFDPAFVAAFGEEGVQAVEEAIAILNGLPSSSGINPMDYPVNATRINYDGQAAGLMDMRSVALQTLVEQLGLASPGRYVFSLRDIQVAAATNFTLIQRNFDPFNLVSSAYINGELYTVVSIVQATNKSLITYRPKIALVDPTAYFGFSAIADKNLPPGGYYTSLTHDDAGGFRYLLNLMNWNVEPLVPGIFLFTHPALPQTNLVGTALRPGIEKITFRRLHFNTNLNNFISVTNFWDDTFSISNEVQQQRIGRVVSVPDILFTAKDMGVERTITPARTNGSTVYPEIRSYKTASIKRSDTGRWINCSSLNGNPGGAGPGVIVPGVTITFPDNRRYLSVAGAHADLLLEEENARLTFDTTVFARFGGDTNVPVILAQSSTNVHAVSLDFTTSTAEGTEWAFLAKFGGIYNVESSSNLTNWTTVQVLTNYAAILRFTDTNSGPMKFYRATRTGFLE